MQYNFAVQTKLRIRYNVDLLQLLLFLDTVELQGMFRAPWMLPVCLCFHISLHDRSVFHVLLCCCLAIPDWT